MTTDFISVQDRIGAAHLLGEKLFDYCRPDAIVIGNCIGGAVIGMSVSSLFKIPFQIITCKKLMHPSKKNFSIGSVSEMDVILNDDRSDIPQDFIAHQIILLKHAARFEREQYSDKEFPISLNGKTAILIADEVTDANALLAGINSIRKQLPSRIIVAMALVSRQAIKAIADSVDDMIYLKINSNPQSSWFSKIDDEDKTLVQSLLKAVN